MQTGCVQACQDYVKMILQVPTDAGQLMHGVDARRPAPAVARVADSRQRQLRAADRPGAKADFTARIDALERRARVAWQGLGADRALLLRQYASRAHR